MKCPGTENYQHRIKQLLKNSSTKDHETEDNRNTPFQTELNMLTQAFGELKHLESETQKLTTEVGKEQKEEMQRELVEINKVNKRKTKDVRTENNLQDTQEKTGLS